MTKNQIHTTADVFLSGDFYESMKLLKEYIGKGRERFEVYQFLTETMRYIGLLWEKQEITVADEHVASNVCRYLINTYCHEYIQQHQPLFSGKNRLKGIFLCVEKEQHDLGVTMVSNIFREKGWETKLLGANTPLEYAEKLVVEWKPNVIGLSASMTIHLPQLIQHIKVMEQIPHKATILVGGRLTQLEDLSPYCASTTIIVNDIDELKFMTNEWDG
ncbi:MAG: cobalamin-dependent protein [Bacillus sp. (in: Bacteria)]|nr:cobalamin-dependent protein [Bacillus sp. (in: firmicutes)]